MKELIKRMVDGDSEAWNEFVKKFNPVIKAKIDKYQGLNDNQRQDAYSEVFEELLKNDFKILKDFEGDRPEQLGAYLKTITYRHCYKKYQSLQKQKEKTNDYVSENIETYEVADTSFEESNSRLLIAEKLWGAIDELEDMYKDVATYKLKGYTLRQIAEILNIKKKTIQTRWDRARKILRKNKNLKELLG